jgi:hypothetical protein
VLPLGHFNALVETLVKVPLLERQLNMVIGLDGAARANPPLTSNVVTTNKATLDRLFMECSSLNLLET